MKTIICHHCDMVSQVPELPLGYVAKCTRCSRVISVNSRYSPEKILALCCTALISLIPAFYFPLISIHLLGITESANLLQGALMMVDSAPLVAFVVLYCAVIAPTLLISTIALSSACLTFNYHPNFLPRVLNITRVLKHWSMLEVYMVSLLVAIFKIRHYADIYFGVGLFFFIALLLLNLIILSNYNNQNYWETYTNG